MLLVWYVGGNSGQISAFGQWKEAKFNFELFKKKEHLFKQLAQLGLSQVMSLHGAGVWSMICPEASPHLKKTLLIP